MLHIKKLTAIRAFKINYFYGKKIPNKYTCLLHYLQFYVGKYLLKYMLLKLNILFSKSSFMIYLTCTKIHIFNISLLLFV